MTESWEGSGPGNRHFPSSEERVPAKKNLPKDLTKIRKSKKKTGHCMSQQEKEWRSRGRTKGRTQLSQIGASSKFTLF